MKIAVIGNRALEYNIVNKLSNRFLESFEIVRFKSIEEITINNCSIFDHIIDEDGKLMENIGYLKIYNNN